MRNNFDKPFRAGDIIKKKDGRIGIFIDLDERDLEFASIYSVTEGRFDTWFVYNQKVHANIMDILFSP